jgi:hypothetical protein
MVGVARVKVALRILGLQQGGVRRDGLGVAQAQPLDQRVAISQRLGECFQVSRNITGT